MPRKKKVPLLRFPPRALAVGRESAALVLRSRRAAQRTRAAALAQLPRRRAAAPAALAAAAAPSRGLLIAEGDSWFDYPFHDVLKELEDLHGFDVDSVAHKGDTVEDMAYSGGQLDAFARCVDRALRRGVRPRALLLSGGGNDIAGDEFAQLLNHARSPHPGLNEGVVAGIVDDRLPMAYATIVTAITDVAIGMLGAPLPIVVHGYDYPVPDGRGFIGGFGPLPGPWLEPGFRRKGYEQLAANKATVRALIDRFNAMLAAFAGSKGFEHVRHLDLRGTLRSGADYRDWWGNELHPTKQGWRAVAARFAAML